MRRFMAWVKSWLTFLRISKQLSTLDYKLMELKASRSSVVNNLEWRQTRLEALDAKIKSELEAIESKLKFQFEALEVSIKQQSELLKIDLDNAKTMQAKDEEQIQSLRAQLSVAEDVMIPGLEGVCRTQQEHVNALTAQEIRTRVGSSLPTEDLRL